MRSSVEAIFKNGVLKPLSTLGLKENHRYRLTLEETEAEYCKLSFAESHPVLGRIRFNGDPSLPLAPEDWPAEEDDASLD